jgi:hypothetical protein
MTADFVFRDDLANDADQLLNCAKEIIGVPKK